MIGTECRYGKHKKTRLNEAGAHVIAYYTWADAGCHTTLGSVRQLARAV